MESKQLSRSQSRANLPADAAMSSMISTAAAITSACSKIPSQFPIAGTHPTGTLLTPYSSRSPISTTQILEAKGGNHDHGNQ